MHTLHIENPITDYPTWRKAYDAVAEVRQGAGVIAERVAQPVDDDRYIFVSLDFDTLDNATSFLHFLETVIWASDEKAPALAGRPKTRLLRPAD